VTEGLAVNAEALTALFAALVLGWRLQIPVLVAVREAAYFRCGDWTSLGRVHHVRGDAVVLVPGATC
jgi:hypothetical protein